MKPKIVCLWLFAVFIVAESFAAPPRHGWTKIELRSADASAKAIPPGLTIPFGGEDVADYGTFRIVAVPESAVDGLAAHAGRNGFRLRRRDELDLIETPGGSIDARVGRDLSIPESKLIRAYPRGQNGLFLVQLIGPPKAEWGAALRKLGWTMARYVQSDAYIIAGPPELASQTRALPFVQFFDFYHPFEKDAALPLDDAEHDLSIALPAIAGDQQTIDAIRAIAAVGSVQVNRYEHDISIRARLTRAAVVALLHDPLIISIEAVPEIGISDERQVMSLTSNLNAAGSQPTTPTGYLAWLTSRCGACSAANMPASTWRVGIADTGLDGGTNGAHHPDLAGREFWGNSFVSPNDACGDCDVATHATMVAGIIAGNRTAGSVDNLGYYDGQGVAPSAGIYSTKILTRGGQPTQDIFAWASDARNDGNATIQNHSWNYYGSVDGYGRYTQFSRNFDIAARDVDNNPANGRTPILFTVSAGNQSPATSTVDLIPPATAKNIISVGGLENYRPGLPNCNGLGDDYRNLMHFGRHGTEIFGYIKPDLVAPASKIVSAKTQGNLNDSVLCVANFDGSNLYQMDSGTSFAAPFAAGAALLVKRYLGSTPASVSPALTKAMLIAGARSIRGGIDRAPETETTIDPAPNSQQGFGRISLDSILTGSTPPLAIDEAVSRQFTTTGQMWKTRLVVRDATKPVVVALVWMDPPGTEDTTHPTPAPSVVVNNLNLTIRPATTTCTYFLGNSLSVADPLKGEESTAFPCYFGAGTDVANTVEYARFFASGYTRFDVEVDMSSYGDPLGEPQPFALVAVNANYDAGSNPVAPQLTATADATTPTNVHLTWTDALNVVVSGYDVSRGSSLADLTNIPGLHTSGFGAAVDDNDRPAGIHTWLYQVTAVLSSSLSLTSNLDYATTTSFTAPDDVLDVVRAAHFTRAMDAVNAVRAAAGLAPASFTSPPPDRQPHPLVTKEHLKNLRDALDAARDAAHLNLPPIQYEEPTAQITAHQSLIRRQHIEEIRQGVQ